MQHKIDQAAFSMAALMQQVEGLPEGMEIANNYPVDFLANVTFALELIGPDKAEEYLHRMPKNRKMSDASVSKAAAAMKRGEWSLNGQTVAFDHNGNVIDGQHRLAVLIEAQMAAWIIVVRGLPEDALETTDTGRTKKLRDFLYMRGESDPATLASVLSWLWRWEKGRMVGGAQADRVPTPQQGLAILEENPGIRTSLVTGRRAGDAVKMGRGVLGMLHYVLSQIDEDDTEEFFARLTDGQALVEGDPIYTLRRVIVNAALRNSTSRGKSLDSEYIAAITIKAWNAYRRGVTDMVQLRWKRGGKYPEAFPEPIVDPE